MAFIMHGKWFWLVTTYIVGVCLLSISFLVFVNASMSFVVTDIVGQQRHVGTDVGTLGFADEVVAIIACPLWGLMSDKYSSRLVVVLGYSTMAIALVCIVQASSVFPDMLVTRLIFSVGGAAVSTMVTAILPSIEILPRDNSPECRTPATNTTLDHAEPVQSSIPGQSTTRRGAPQGGREISSTNEGSISFKAAGLVGVAAGCGALLAVFGYLRLPPRLQELDVAPGQALQATFYSVAAVSAFAAVACFFGLRPLSDPTAHCTSARARRPIMSLSSLPLLAAARDDAIMLAYLGGFVARTSSVGISLFIPLWVNSFYSQNGRCHIDDPSRVKNECAEAYKLASILTGVSQLAALLLAPAWGYFSARCRAYQLPLAIAAVCGLVGYSAISTFDDPRLSGGWKSVSIAATAVLLGASQIGAIVCSLGLVSFAVIRSRTETKSTDASGEETTTADVISGDMHCIASESTTGSPEAMESTESTNLLSTKAKTKTTDLSDAKGSIAGMYSFIGGVGILILTKTGGYLFDRVGFSAPFILLAVFNGLLLLGSFITLLVKGYRG